MNLTELIAAVGLENVKVQRMDTAIVGACNKKKGVTELRIETETAVFGADDLLGITCGKPPHMHGLIIWIPRDKIPTP